MAHVPGPRPSHEPSVPGEAAHAREAEERTRSLQEGPAEADPVEEPARRRREDAVDQAMKDVEESISTDRESAD